MPLMVGPCRSAAGKAADTTTHAANIASEKAYEARDQFGNVRSAIMLIVDSLVAIQSYHCIKWGVSLHTMGSQCSVDVATFHSAIVV